MADDPQVEDLLDGLEGQARAERAELVAWLLQRGFTPTQIRGAISPLLLASRRAIGADDHLVSARDIAEVNGLDLERVIRVLRAVGLPTVDDPDSPVYLAADGNVVAHTARFLALGLDADALVQATRTLAEGLSHAAEMMRLAALGAILHPGVTELEIAQESERILGAATPLLGPMVTDMLMLQLRHLMEDEAVDASERAQGVPLAGARPVAIAFADLVGFTRLGEEMPPEELEQLANRLAELARDVAQPPVRFVKSIGDAVMLVCPDPIPLLTAMLALNAAVEDDDAFPQLRVGVAYGDAVTRAGDWFGSPVNLASRLTGAARAGAVVVSEPAREAIGDAAGFSWSFAGGRRLKGISGDTKMFRVRSAS